MSTWIDSFFLRQINRFPVLMNSVFGEYKRTNDVFVNTRTFKKEWIKYFLQMNNERLMKSTKYLSICSNRLGIVKNKLKLICYIKKPTQALTDISTIFHTFRTNCNSIVLAVNFSWNNNYRDRLECIKLETTLLLLYFYIEKKLKWPIYYILYQKNTFQLKHQI